MNQARLEKSKNELFQCSGVRLYRDSRRRAVLIVRNVQFMSLIWFSNVLAQVCIEILGGSSLLGRLDVEKNDG